MDHISCPESLTPFGGEAFFDVFFNHTEAGIFITDQSGRFLRMNQKFCDMTGYSENGLAVLTLKDLFHPEEQAHYMQDFSMPDENRTKYYVKELRYLKKDGSIFWVNATVWLAVDSQNQTSLFLVLVQNITEQKRKEIALSDSKEVLESIFDTTYPMIAYLDTDFNFIRVNRPYTMADGHTPEFFVGKNHFDPYPNEENEAIFRNVVKTGEPISFSAKPFEYEYNLELGVTYWDWDLIPVKSADGILKGLVFGLVNVTEQKQAEEGLRKANETLELHVRMRTSELKKEIEERKQVEEALRQSERRYREVFDTFIEEKIIACDVDLIERIMLNLLSNAIKFTNTGGTISVQIYNKNDRIVISVKDTGIGIPKDKLDVIFERYRQVSHILTREHEGSGIGLSLVKSLVEMHEGKISVRSDYGKGSEFLVELPCKILPMDHSLPESMGYIPHNHRFIERMHVGFSDIYK